MTLRIPTITLKPARQQMWRLIQKVFPFLALLSAGLSAPPETEAAERLQTATVRDQATRTFDQVWEQVRDQYFDFQRIEVDWEEARQALRPLAIDRDPSALRPVLQDLLDIIGESHFVIVPGEAIDQLSQLDASRPAEAHSDRQNDTDGQPAGLATSSIEALTSAAIRADTVTTGMAIRLVDDQVRVTTIRSGSAADQAGIQPGWVVDTVNGLELSATLGALTAMERDDERRRAIVLLELGLQSMASLIPADRTVELTLVDTAGLPIQKRLRGQPLSHGTTQIGNLPPMAFDFQRERKDIEHGCVQIVSFSSWVPALTEAFQAERDAVFSCQGLVIDLRGNPGGVLTTMVPLAADLFQEPVILGTLVRSDARLDFRVLPRRVAMDGQRLRPFEGPIAILIDSLSASTSEMFAAGMQATGRAKLFGQPSAGMALPSQMLPLANGDFLMYAFADYRDSQDRRIEGIGARPDVPVHLTEQNLAQSPSPTLAAALDWIAQQLSP